MQTWKTIVKNFFRPKEPKTKNFKSALLRNDIAKLAKKK